MKLEAIRRRAGRPKKEEQENGGQFGHDFEAKKAREIIAEEAGDSPRNVQRFIRLNELSEPLRDKVDNGELGFTPAVELSFLKPQEQEWVERALDETQQTPSLSQAQRIKQESKEGTLTEDTVHKIISEEKGIPVIYVSAKADVQSRVQGLRLGAEDYLVKPFDILELLVRMEKVLARADRQPKQLIYRDIAVDLESRSVTKGGEMISLKNMEYELLLTFLQHPGIVMTREDLLHQVWGDEFIGETRTVDVHVAALRRKLDLNKELATVYKIGYRLEMQP